jgi:hypothetical protein
VEYIISDLVAFYIGFITIRFIFWPGFGNNWFRLITSCLNFQFGILNNFALGLALFLFFLISLLLVFLVKKRPSLLFYFSFIFALELAIVVWHSSPLLLIALRKGEQNFTLCLHIFSCLSSTVQQPVTSLASSLTQSQKRSDTSALL